MKPALSAFLLAIVTGFATRGSAAVETYTIDAVHSSIGFSIRHFVSKVPGRFTRFDGVIKVDRDNPANSSVAATIDAASIDTGNQKRDAHLRNPDFLEVERYPKINFKSTSWRKTGDDTYEVTGDLTIKDVTKPVTLKVTSLGFGPGSRGVQLSGWEATTTINKQEFNVKDPAMLDAALGEDIAITINIEAKKT